jgi:hypothetical protein
MYLKESAGGKLSTFRGLNFEGQIKMNGDSLRLDII